MQLTLGILFCHLILKPAVLDRMYHQATALGTKTKYKVSQFFLSPVQHWLYDISFKYSAAIALFTLVLFFSILIPLILPLGAFTFTLAVSRTHVIKL